MKMPTEADIEKYRKEREAWLAREPKSDVDDYDSNVEFANWQDEEPNEPWNTYHTWLFLEKEKRLTAVEREFGELKRQAAEEQARQKP